LTTYLYKTDVTYKISWWQVTGSYITGITIKANAKRNGCLAVNNFKLLNGKFSILSSSNYKKLYKIL